MVYVLYDKLGNWLIKLQDSIHFGIEFSDSEEWGENFCSSLADAIADILNRQLQNKEKPNMPGYWKRASERALSIDAERAAETERQNLLDQIRDALRHSADDAELRIRLQKLLDERGDSGVNI
ncbi:hypothetical protein [uncultured Victivallis sp.]|uniref:hypothetical protein n=1 Tax=uncultured Victivallis sp. TaxID=354118 RepID=UPI0025DE5E0A|nr:hypothetical protein [uncultured Victivallis sp.]